MRIKHLYLSLLVISALLTSGCQKNDAVDRNPLTYLAELVAPNEDKLRQELQDNLTSSDPEIRLEGIDRLSAGRPAAWPNTPRILALMVKSDPDEHVRYHALRALHRIDPDHPELSLPADETIQHALEDESAQVRLECVKILQKKTTEENLNHLIKLLNTEKKPEIRRKIAESLGKYPYPASLNALINHLTDESFAVAYWARKSLKKLTGEDFKYDPFLWRDWLNEHPDAFNHPAAN